MERKANSYKHHYIFHRETIIKHIKLATYLNAIDNIIYFEAVWLF